MPDQAPPAPRRAPLSHRQARGSLALLLDATTEPALAARLRQHVDGCARCQDDLEQLRQAEAWLLAQPVEAPQMRATQDSAWAAIQARIAAENGAAPLAEKARANGHSHLLDHQASAAAEALIPLAAADEDALADEANPLPQPLPVPQPPAPVTIAAGAAGKAGGIFNPRRALFVALAATLVVGSFAALFLAHFSASGVPPDLTSTQLFKMGVLDPGSETPAFSFDPVSRRLLALTGAMSYGCPPGAHCPYSGPTCLGFSMLDVDTGKSLGAVRPTCTPGKPAKNSITFTDLLDDSPLGEALLVDNNEQVTTVDNRSGAVVRTYALACCSRDYAQPYQTLLDERDQLLLTTALSGVNGVSDTLVAQDATTGKVKYQENLPGTQVFRAALVSNVTGWFYTWNRCSTTSSTSCVEAYVANSGKKAISWEAAAQQTPLAADPTENLLYVRQDDPDGQSETLLVDGRSGRTVDHLPAAQAVAINAPLHHAYLLDDDGVTVVDTRSRRKLSTLPVLARDESWIAPAVDTTTGRVYVPIQRGKLLVAQDDAAGQLRLRSGALAVVLEAERAMVVDEASKGETGLYPWELPVGPGSSPVYHPMSQGNQSDCGIGWVAARSTAAISAQNDGHYQVQLSLAWDDHFAQSTATTPASQSSYPHEHTWLYDVPASGAASLSGEHGAAFPHC